MGEGGPGGTGGGGAAAPAGGRYAATGDIDARLEGLSVQLLEGSSVQLLEGPSVQLLEGLMVLTVMQSVRTHTAGGERGKGAKERGAKGRGSGSWGAPAAGGGDPTASGDAALTRAARPPRGDAGVSERGGD
eukprot:gene24738-27742_t